MTPLPLLLPLSDDESDPDAAGDAATPRRAAQRRDRPVMRVLAHLHSQ